MKAFDTKWAMDFTCVMDLMGFQVFIVVILEHARRAGLRADKISEIALEINPDMFQ